MINDRTIKNIGPNMGNRKRDSRNKNEQKMSAEELSCVPPHCTGAFATSLSAIVALTNRDTNTRRHPHDNNPCACPPTQHFSGTLLVGVLRLRAHFFLWFIYPVWLLIIFLSVSYVSAQSPPVRPFVKNHFVRQFIFRYRTAIKKNYIFVKRSHCRSPILLSQQVGSAWFWPISSDTQSYNFNFFCVLDGIRRRININTII